MGGEQITDSNSFFFKCLCCAEALGEIKTSYSQLVDNIESFGAGTIRTKEKNKRFWIL